MEVMEAIKTRRSCRAYLDKPVEREKIEAIVEAGRAAPSGSNSHTTHYIVITNQEILSHLSDLVRSEFARMAIRPDMYIGLKNSIYRSKQGSYIFHYNAPVLIITANKRNYGNNMADCVGALENMMLLANELDLGSCYINQLHWLTDNPEVRTYLLMLGLGEDEVVCASAIFGYAKTPDELPPRNERVITGDPVTWIE